VAGTKRSVDTYALKEIDRCSQRSLLLFEGMAQFPYCPNPQTSFAFCTWPRVSRSFEGAYVLLRRAGGKTSS
jgi:hypothetical protein